MARYSPYNRGIAMPQDFNPGEVPYISYYNPQRDEMLMQGMETMQNRWDVAQSAIAKYLEEAGATEMRNIDKNYVIDQVTQNIEKLKKNIKEKYNGDYGLAVNDVIQNLSKSSSIYKQAGQDYKEAQKYEPILMNLEAQKKLLWDVDPTTGKIKNDPRTQSAWVDGKHIGIDYSGFREKSDYDKEIAQDVVAGIDKTSKESGLISSGVEGILKSVNTKGLAALDQVIDRGDERLSSQQRIDKNLNRIATEYAPVFRKKTTAGIDPNMANGNDVDYIKKAIYRMATNVTDNQYVTDPLADERYKATHSKTPPRQIIGSGMPSLEVTGVKDNESYSEAVNYRKGFFRQMPAKGTIGGKLFSGTRQQDITSNLNELKSEREYYTLQNSIKELYNQGGSPEELNKLREKARQKYDSLVANGIIPIPDNNKGIEEVDSDISRYNNIKSTMEVTKMNYRDDLAKQKGYKNYDELRNLAGSNDKDKKTLDKVNGSMPTSEQGWLKIMDQKRELTKNRIGNIFPLTDKDVNEGLKTLINSNPSRISFYTDANGESTALADAGKYLYGGSDGGEKLMTYIQQEVVKNPDKFLGVDKSTGLYTIDVPEDITIKNGKAIAGGNYKTIRMSLPTKQRDISNGLLQANSLTHNPSKEIMEADHPIKFLVGDQLVEYKFDKSQLDDPDNSPVFTVTNLSNGMKAKLTLNQLQTTGLQDHINTLDATYQPKSNY